MNRCTRFCRPLRDHSATVPYKYSSIQRRVRLGAVWLSRDGLFEHFKDGVAIDSFDEVSSVGVLLAIVGGHGSTVDLNDEELGGFVGSGLRLKLDNVNTTEAEIKFTNGSSSESSEATIERRVGNVKRGSAVLEVEAPVNATLFTIN